MRRSKLMVATILFCFIATMSAFASAGNTNDLAKLGYEELETTASVDVTDEIVVFESDVPKQGGTVQDIVNLAVSGTTTTTYSAQVSVTLAELNAGKTIVAAVTGKQIVVVNFVCVMDGNFGGLTSAELEDSSATVNVCSLAQAQMTDNAVLTPGVTGVTAGVGMAEGLTVSEALVITHTGANATTATGMTVVVEYKLV